MKEIYRYISFESFVDMIQRQCLNFVHPTTWEDPQELLPYKLWLEDFQKKNPGKVFDILLHEIRMIKLYAQCWTCIDESDALWRIYSYNNFSIRISIDVEDVYKLGNVYYHQVIYTDDFNNLSSRIEYDKIFCIKRNAFSHEQEVRLLYEHKFRDTDDFQYQAITMLMKHDVIQDEKLEWTHKFYDGKSLNEMKQDIEQRTTNLFYDKPTKDVSFAHISGFIKSVTLNPFAPKWFSTTVEQFCMNNNISYLGQSKLYSEIH